MTAAVTGPSAGASSDARVPYGPGAAAPAAHPAAAQRGASAWLISPRFDLAVFTLPVLLALSLAALSGALSEPAGETPTWAWLLFVAGIDVAHVHATSLRVYFDRTELRRRLGLYTTVPALGFGLSVLLYNHSPLMFWRCLAYVALFHFIRQQIGWARLYRRRARDQSRFDARLDEFTLYAATICPVIVWHTRLPVSFHWFTPGDFIEGLPLTAASFAGLVGVLSLCAFYARQVQRHMRGEPLAWGKLLLVATTAASWWVGIVFIADDFAFTITNVVAHGIPYMAISWRVAEAHERTQAREPRWFLRGALSYVFLLALLAGCEEWLWGTTVWHEHLDLFQTPTLDTSAFAALVVPLLALPQITHYILDAYLWRMDGNNLALTKLLSG